MPIDILRLETIHPLLVHASLGAIPFLVLAYAVAWRRRSESWAFAADTVLAFTAAITVLTVTFGFVADQVVHWPGGLGLWRALHLGFGVGSAVLLLAFAAIRLRARKEDPRSGSRSLLAALVLAGVIAFTGWIGGEVLVFHAGMAVRAAGGGALAPPVTGPRDPADLQTAMHDLRGHWALATSTIAASVVSRPTSETFESVRNAAIEMQRVTASIAEARLDDEPEPGVRFMADLVTEHARELEHAAEAGRIDAMVDPLGRITAVCASCHRSFRWDPKPEEAELAAR
jgi:uncharacterized membrane protein